MNVFIFPILYFNNHGPSKSINSALLPAEDNFVPGRYATLLAVSPLPEVLLLFNCVHGHYYHHHKPILIMVIDTDSDEVAHMVEKLISIFYLAQVLPFTSLPSSSSSSVINSKGSMNP